MKVDLGSDNSPEHSEARKQAAALIATYIGVSSLPEDPERRGEFVSTALDEAVSGKSIEDILCLISSLGLISSVLAHLAARPVDWDAYEEDEGDPLEILHLALRAADGELDDD